MGTLFPEWPRSNEHGLPLRPELNVLVDGARAQYQGWMLALSVAGGGTDDQGASFSLGSGAYSVRSDGVQLHAHALFAKDAELRRRFGCRARACEPF